MDLTHLHLRTEENWLQNRLGSQPMTYLPTDFVLNENDVLCGRGAVCFNHIGTKKFRQLIDSKLDAYVHANRVGKTKIICDLVHYIRSNSPSGGFVKLDLDRGRYYEVGDFMAREKTSQAFRDALNDKKNSKKQKNQGGRMMPFHHSLSDPMLSLDKESDVIEHFTYRVLSNQNIDRLCHINASFTTTEQRTELANANFQSLLHPSSVRMEVTEKEHENQLNLIQKKINDLQASCTICSIDRDDSERTEKLILSALAAGDDNVVEIPTLQAYPSLSQNMELNQPHDQYDSLNHPSPHKNLVIYGQKQTPSSNHLQTIEKKTDVASRVNTDGITPSSSSNFGLKSSYSDLIFHNEKNLFAPLTRDVDMKHNANKKSENACIQSMSTSNHEALNRMNADDRIAINETKMLMLEDGTSKDCNVFEKLEQMNRNLCDRKMSMFHHSISTPSIHNDLQQSRIDRNPLLKQCNNHSDKTNETLLNSNASGAVSNDLLKFLLHSQTNACRIELTDHQNIELNLLQQKYDTDLNPFNRDHLEIVEDSLKPKVQLAFEKISKGQSCPDLYNYMQLKHTYDKSSSMLSTSLPLNENEFLQASLLQQSLSWPATPSERECTSQGRGMLVKSNISGKVGESPQLDYVEANYSFSDVGFDNQNQLIASFQYETNRNSSNENENYCINPLWSSISNEIKPDNAAVCKSNDRIMLDLKSNNTKEADLDHNLFDKLEKIAGYFDDHKKNNDSWSMDLELIEQLDPELS